MNTREYQNYKRMTKMTVRFLEKDGTITDPKSKTETKETTKATTTTTTSSITTTPISTLTETKVNFTTTSTTTIPSSKVDVLKTDNNLKLQPLKNEPTPAPESKFKNVNVTNFTLTDDSLVAKKTQILTQKSQKSTNGRYVNWSTQHSTLASLPWCCIGDLMTFCDKYEYRTISRNDPQMHNRIVTEVKTLLNGPAPFDIRKRFPNDIHSPENLWVCIGRCTGVEYHLNRIISVFRRPLDKLSADKQRMVRHDFHLAVNELRLDISARISEVRLYDQNVFEKEFRLEWQEETD